MASRDQRKPVAGAGSPPRDGSTMYGSFSFPTPPLTATASAVPELARREADLAQREREISERERKVAEASRTFLGFEMGALRRMGRPLWRDAPPQYILLCKRLWQLWAVSVILFAWNWMVEVSLSLMAGGDPFIESGSAAAHGISEHSAGSTLSTSTGSTAGGGAGITAGTTIEGLVPSSLSAGASAHSNGSLHEAVPPGRLLWHRGLDQATPASSRPPIGVVGGQVVGGQVGLATLLLLLVPISSWCGWCHPLLDAALTHGTSDPAGFCGLMALAAHVLLCAIASLGPPGCGLAGLMLGVSAMSAGYSWTVLAALMESLSFLIATVSGLELYRRTLRTGLLRFGPPPSAHAPPPMPPACKAPHASHISYGRI